MSNGNHRLTSDFCFLLHFSQGGFDYKRAIVECIICIIEDNPESKETGLAHLCEFIEDCEFTVLATRILHLLGREGARTPNPSKYIRFIYNRVILENEEVRAGESLFVLTPIAIVCINVLLQSVRSGEY